MSLLLLRLRAPLQSWGVGSNNLNRSTERFPTKSGVIGMIASALGRERHENIADLTNLRMAAGELVAGSITVDYQTVGGGYDWWDAAILPEDGGNALFPKKTFENDREPVSLREKSYLEDADFLVGFEGDTTILASISAALDDPKRLLFLGRKCCVLSHPPLVGMFEGDLEKTMTEWSSNDGRRIARLILEVPYDQANQHLSDVPLNFGQRSYRGRGIVVKQIRRIAA